jgi:hypothetical protein
MSDEADPLEDARMEELAAVPVEPRKKRKASTSPTARTLAECRKRGWIAQVVEQHLPFPKPFGTKRDLFGVIDIVAIEPSRPAFGPGEIGTPAVLIGIQATASAAHHAHRRAKILAEPRMRDWLETGARLELWSWAKQGARGKAKRWTLRVEAFTVENWRDNSLPAELVPDAIAVHLARRTRA